MKTDTTQVLSSTVSECRQSINQSFEFAFCSQRRHRSRRPFSEPDPGYLDTNSASSAFAFAFAFR